MLLLLWLAACSIQTLYAEKSCLFCSDVMAPTDCSRIQRCGPHEECYTDMYLTEGGGTRYNLGCRDTKQCAGSQAHTGNIGSAKVDIVCSQCCSGDICNSVGCEYRGYPSPRGPICSKCSWQPAIGECDNITMCQPDEVCMLGRTRTPGAHELHLITKCEKAAACYDNLRRTRIMFTNLGKRQTQEKLQIGTACLMKCCKTDMCNDNCI